MVNTVEDAKHAVDAVRYAPEGSRGVGLARAQGYGIDFKEYFEWQKKESIVIIQIEHKLALENLEPILKVHGVDGLIIGPYDLSCSMGIPGQFEHPEFKEAMDYILETGKKLSVPTGLHIIEPDEKSLENCVNEGFRFIAYSVDIRILDVVAREGIIKFRELNQ